MRERAWIYALLIIAAAGVAAAPMPWPRAASFLAGAICTLGALTTLASAVRTVSPRFSMDVITALGVLGISMVVCVAEGIGFFLLVLPGFYVLARVGLAPQIFALLRASGRGDELWDATLDVTEGDRVWHSLGITVMAYALQWGLGSVLSSLTTAANASLRAALLTAATIFVVQATHLAYVRFIAVSLPDPLTPHAYDGVPVPAAP